jgi:hypothetical protein
MIADTDSGALWHVSNLETRWLELTKSPPQPSLALESNSMNIESPPLTTSESVDIQAAEEEFASGHTETYESPQDLIAALHATREQYRRSAGEQ